MACSSRGGSSALSSHDSSGMSIQHLSQIGNRSPFPNQPVPPHAAAASSDRNQEDHSIPNRDDMDEDVEYVGTLHRRSSRRKFDATLPKERYTTYANRKPGSRKHIPVDHLPNNGHNSFFIPYGRTIFVKERKTPPEERKSPPEQRKSPPEQFKSPHEQRKSPPEQRKSPPEKQKKRQKKKRMEPCLWKPPGRWIDPVGKWIGSKGVKVTKVHTPANHLGELNLHNSQINNQGNSNLPMSRNWTKTVSATCSTTTPASLSAYHIGKQDQTPVNLHGPAFQSFHPVHPEAYIIVSFSGRVRQKRMSIALGFPRSRWTKPPKFATALTWEHPHEPHTVGTDSKRLSVTSM